MKLIILDRDGVINYESATYIKTPDEWKPIPGSLEAIAQLNQAGYEVIVATNQSGVGRGYYDLPMLKKIHEKMLRELELVGGKIKQIFFCPHHPDNCCNCRKPKPGLFHQIEKEYNVNMNGIFFIGDSFSDIQVAQSVGCTPILVLTGKGQLSLNNNPELAKILCFKDLARAVQYIISCNYSATHSC